MSKHGQLDAMRGNLEEALNNALPAMMLTELIQEWKSSGMSQDDIQDYLATVANEHHRLMEHHQERMQILESALSALSRGRKIWQG